MFGFKNLIPYCHFCSPIKSTGLGVMEKLLQLDEMSVGAHVDVSHTAATPIGATVTATATLSRTRRKTFRVRRRRARPGRRNRPGRPQARHCFPRPASRRRREAKVGRDGSSRRLHCSGRRPQRQKTGGTTKKSARITGRAAEAKEFSVLVRCLPSSRGFLKHPRCQSAKLISEI